MGPIAQLGDSALEMSVKGPDRRKAASPSSRSRIVVAEMSASSDRFSLLEPSRSGLSPTFAY